MSEVKTFVFYGPLMMSLATFADLHEISESTARLCAKGLAENYPPLETVTSTGGKPRLYVTAEAAAKWRAAMTPA